MSEEWSPADFHDAPEEEWLGDIADALADVEQRVTRHPLSCWRAWDSPFTSQRKALQATGGPNPPKRVAFIGGNQSGKTEAAFRMVLHMTLGSDHPETIAWAALNGIDISGWPKGPDTAYVVALDQNSSRNYHRTRFAEDKLGSLPAKWWNLDAATEAILKIEVPGYSRPAKFVFRSIEQGQKAFQGDAVRVIWIDEEESDANHETAGEALVRVAAKDGWFIRSMTPYIRGYSWAVPFFHEGSAVAGGWVVRTLFPQDSPYVNERVVEESAGDSASLRAARMRGEWVVSGVRQVYPDAQALYTYDPVTMTTLEGARVPYRGAPGSLAWYSYRGVDFGSRAPTAIVFAYVNDDCVVVYAEHYLASPDSSEHIAAALAVDPPEAWGTTWGDPAARAQREDWSAAGYAVDTGPADRTIAGSVSMVNGLIRQGRLFISSKCPLLLKFMRSYQWSDTDDRPVKGQEDHLPDALRYLIRGLLDSRAISPVASGR